jgi:hypothetical protein
MLTLRTDVLGDLSIQSYQSPPISDDIPDGYPPLNKSAIPPCNGYGPQETCNRQRMSNIIDHLRNIIKTSIEFLNGIINHPPVYGPYTTPIYSNLAYSILGLVYMNITGKDMTQGFLDLYHGKLGMNSSYALYPGPEADAVIPRNDSYALFSYDIGLSGP